MTDQLTRQQIDHALEQASITHHLLVAPGAMTASATLVPDLFPGRPAVIVADETTWRLAGQPVRDVLLAAGHPVADPIIFPATPTLRPDTRHVTAIRTHLEAEGIPVLPIAAGSGSINDLTKRAAHEAGVPYVSVATAASMDGYTASGAALIDNGVKQTFACNAPVAVIADLDVLCAAPPAMTASGYGDLLGKVTAGADWIVADALGIEPIEPGVWEMVQGPLPSMIANPARYQTGDPASIEQLFLGLIMTGLAIQASGSTRCASGSEHQFSHLWEMRGLEHNGELVSHGIKVGFGSIFSAALYERLLARDWRALDIDAAVARWPAWPAIDASIRAMADSPALIERALIECRAKYVDRAGLRDRLLTFRDAWPDLANRLRSHLMSPEALRKHLVAVHAATTPEEIGLTHAEVRASYAAARRIRRRYTILDLVDDMGLLDDLVGDVYAPGGFWGP